MLDHLSISRGHRGAAESPVTSSISEPVEHLQGSSWIPLISPLMDVPVYTGSDGIAQPSHNAVLITRPGAELMLSKLGHRVFWHDVQQRAPSGGHM